MEVGCLDGELLGLGDGKRDGDTDGKLVGLVEGIFEGKQVGFCEGKPDGKRDGSAEGKAEGISVGSLVGRAVGILVGLTVGFVGMDVGRRVGKGDIGRGVGALVGEVVGDKEHDGLKDGVTAVDLEVIPPIVSCPTKVTLSGQSKGLCPQVFRIQTWEKAVIETDVDDKVQHLLVSSFDAKAAVSVNAANWTDPLFDRPFPPIYCEPDIEFADTKAISRSDGQRRVELDVKETAM